MRQAKVRNSIFAASGTLAYLATIAFFNLGCPGGNSTTQTEPVVSVFVDPNASTVVAGSTVQLHAATYTTGGLQVYGRNVAWSSGNPTVATVSTGGLVTGVSAGGPVAITATSEGKSGSAQVTVLPIAVATVTVAGAASVAVNGTAQFTATLRDASGTVLTNRVVTWASSAPILATVSGTGVVTGVAVGGPVTITATSENKSGSAQVMVTPTPVATVLVSGDPFVPVNGTAQYTASLLDAGGNVLTGRVITWTSSAPNVASVSPSGLVTGVAAGGPVTITATSENRSGSATVTITANPSILTGRVIDYTTQTGIAGASVHFFGGLSLTDPLGSTSTGADGTFTSPALTGSTTHGVLMEAVATGFVTGRVLVDDVPPGATTFTQPIPLVPQSVLLGGISGTVRDARTGQGINSANVLLYNNVNPASVASTTADASGLFTISSLTPGTYRLSGAASGYTPAVRVGVAVGTGAVTSGQDIVLSPTGTNDIRIVLTWGATPSDLDSHLTGPNADATRFHVYYSSRGNLTAPPFALLDIDDVSSFGPETITITQFNSGNYRYSVHDYSNRFSSTSTALGHSSAKVEVYTSSGLVQTFFVPNQAGTLWTVFEMTGTIANPVITPRNLMELASDPSTILSPPVDGSPRGTDAGLISSVVLRHPKAKPR